MATEIKKLNVSSSPHARSPLTTGSVMYDVALALMPATFFGVYHFGFHALLIVLTSVLSAVLTEYIFDYVAHRPNTIRDGSAVVTGLLLGLCLSPTVPLYIPFAGSVFAILVVKCLFGGLGQNFMNPALAGRCFLLISFGAVMTDFGIDGLSSATPLAVLSNGGSVDVLEMFLGFTGGTIGVSCAALLLGGVYLLATGGITWQIPVSYLGSFAIAISLIGRGAFDPAYLLAQFFGGGLLMGALFMATDPVTSPITGYGQLLYGVFIGVLTAIFRVYGSSTDSVSYAIVLGNLLVPLIDRVSIPKPFGLGDNNKTPKPVIPRAAAVLAVITLISGLALGGVNVLTRGAIEEQTLAANAAAYSAVIPKAQGFGYDDAISANVDEYKDEVYGHGLYGKVYINEVVVGQDASGNAVGYAVNVTTSDGFDGNIGLSVGFDPEGTIQGISFIELTETPGMGMRADEDEFKSQFVGKNVEAFALVKGGASAENEIDSISGASTTSGAVVNAVNAAVDFFAKFVR